MEINVRFATTTDFDYCQATDHDKDELRLRHKIAAHELLVAEVAGEPVGYLRLEYIWGFVPYLALIRVRDDVRRQGVGRTMLAHLADHLRMQGEWQLLSSSQADEPQPQAWHRHMGFAECGYIAAINGSGVGEVFFRLTLKQTNQEELK